MEKRKMGVIVTVHMEFMADGIEDAEQQAEELTARMVRTLGEPGETPVKWATSRADERETYGGA